MAEYEAEGDGFDMMETQDPIIQAAADGDIPEVRRQLSLGMVLSSTARTGSYRPGLRG